MKHKLTRHGIPKTYLRIWKTVQSIPKGRVSTYGMVARLAGFGRHARLTGYALHALPPGTNIPWHRVINAKGEISFRKNGNHHRVQERLLRREGVTFTRGRVDLSRFGWPLPGGRTISN